MNMYLYWAVCIASIVLFPFALFRFLQIKQFNGKLNNTYADRRLKQAAEAQSWVDGIANINGMVDFHPRYANKGIWFRSRKLF